MTLKEQIKELANIADTITIKEVATKLSCDTSHVGKVAKELGIKFKKYDRANSSYMIKAGHRLTRIKNLTNLGYTNQEICLLTDEEQTTLTKYKHKQDIPTNYYKQINLTWMQEQIIIGSVLGDAGIRPSDNGESACIQFKHSTKQEDYFTYKYNMLANLTYPNKRCLIRKPAVRQRTTSIMGGEVKTYECIDVTSIYHPCLLDYRLKFYPNGIKVVPRDIVEKLDVLGLAIWFMDDGVKFYNNQFKICTHSFTLDDVEYLCNLLFRKFNIQCKPEKDSGEQYLICITSKNTHDFRRLIEPYVVPSMAYKLYKNEQLD